MKRKYFSAFCLASGLCTTAIAADGLRPLEETVTESTESSYALVRCAAFYTSALEWAGTALKQDDYDRTKKSVDSLLLVASVMRSANSADVLQDVAEVVLIDARKIADIYIENLRDNYAVTGNAWEGNLVYEADGAYCLPIAQTAIAMSDDLNE
ncbi:hypothetical protein ACVDG3_16210 [Meridianimarinicoccus sp. RP-17]|uniref:hypothetical protein n=1 Tax=Meridianimarinicoccus zhengii TaxID=2056810 RepID=UPI0013A698ED|nr:hypothetical protein [Phycocomes zhengii]